MVLSVVCHVYYIYIYIYTCRLLPDVLRPLTSVNSPGREWRKVTSGQGLLDSGDGFLHIWRMDS